MIMKTNFTQNGKFKNLINSMFNSKMFCLMKKHVYSLMMVLALMVFAGASAFAQADGTDGNPYWHVTGSSHTLHVTANANSTFTWTSDATVGSTSSDALTAMETTGELINITWSEYAAGQYYFDVTETDNTNSCKQTIRRIYVNVLSFDVEAYFSDATGNIEADAAKMSACGEGTTPNYGNVGTSGAADAFDNLFNGNGDLAAFTGTNPRTQRQITLVVHWIVPPAATTFTAPTIGSIEFTYALTLTDAEGTFNSFNGNTATGDNGEYVDGSSLTYDIPIDYDVEWGAADVTTSVTVTNCKLFSGAGATGTLYGTESASNIGAAGSGTTPYPNTTATQTIWSAPATTIIGVD